MTTDNHPSLEAVEQEARIAKLNAELRILENQLTPRFHRLEMYKAIGAPIAAAVAVAGILLSTTQWYDGARATRELRRQEQIERHLERLAAADASHRITAVASLRFVLSVEDGRAAEQASAALAEVLAVEDSFAVRNAIVSALSAISGSTVASRRTAVLEELVNVSRGLVAEGKLWQLRGANGASLAEPAGTAARAVSVGHAIAALLRQGARSSDLSGIYLAGADLTKLELSRINFGRAILVEARFDRSTMDESIFDDAILANTSFRHSRLLRASFRQTIRITDHAGRTNYVLEQVYPLQLSPDSHVTVIGPYFDGADLTGAAFDGHPLFPIYDNELHHHAIVSGFSFRSARLDDVDLRKAWAFGLRRRDVLLPSCRMQWVHMPQMISFGGAPLELVAGQAVHEPANPQPLVECRRTLDLIGRAFSGSTRSKGLSLNFIEAAIANKSQRERHSG